MLRPHYHPPELRSTLARALRGELVPLTPHALPGLSLGPWWPWRAWYLRPVTPRGFCALVGPLERCAWGSLVEPCEALSRRRVRWRRRHVGLLVQTQEPLPWGDRSHHLRPIVRRARVASQQEVCAWWR